MIRPEPNRRILQIGLSHNKGGVEVFVLNYARALYDRGVMFDYADLYGAGLAMQDEISALGGRIHAFPNYKRHPLRVRRRLTELLRTEAYDAVHINMLSAASLLPIRAAIDAGVPVIVHSHNSGTVGLHRKLLHAMHTRTLKRLPIVRLACSRRAGEWLFCGKEFRVVHNAVDLSQFRYDPTARRALRQQYNIEQDTTLLGFVGRLSPQKNPLFLLEILHSISDPSVKLVVVGDGPMKDALLQKAAELGLSDRLCMVGIQENIAPWYSAMDAFLLPSIFEGLPLVAVEAQVSGLPCFFSEHISGEVCLTDLAQILPLDPNGACWAEAIAATRSASAEREHYADTWSRSDYSIAQSAEILQQIYESQGNQT